MSQAPMEERRIHFDTWGIMEVLTKGTYADRVKSMLRQGGPEYYSLVTSQVSLVRQLPSYCDVDLTPHACSTACSPCSKTAG